MVYSDKIVENILDLYFTFTKLKTVPRTGWIYWQLREKRVESIAEHTYGAICLAMAIFANTTLELDIQKVVTMLALHETEEIYIGDLTPFDKEGRKTKKEDGAKAVQKVFNSSTNKQMFLDLIAEFEEHKTPEAHFAHQIDKLEADLQARKYDDFFELEKLPDFVKNDEKIVELKNQGLNKVSEFFLANDFHLFDGITLAIAEYLKKHYEKIDTKE